jgi:hypothetical protein
MATKKELLKALTDAGVTDFTLDDSKTDLEAAVAALVPAVNRQKGV